MLGRCIALIEKYNFTKVYIDGANPSFIRSLKQMLGKGSYYEKVIEYYKKVKWHWKEHMQVIPVNFSTEHREMLGKAKMLMEEGKVAINPIFEVALRPALSIIKPSAIELHSICKQRKKKFMQALYKHLVFHVCLF
jgi:hypothetical protein